MWKFLFVFFSIIFYYYSTIRFCPFHILWKFIHSIPYWYKNTRELKRQENGWENGILFLSMQAFLCPWEVDETTVLNFLSSNFFPLVVLPFVLCIFLSNPDYEISDSPFSSFLAYGIKAPFPFTSLRVSLCESV